MIKYNSPCIIYHKTRYGSYTISIDFATLLPPGPNFPWIRFYCWCAERILLEQILLSNNETTFCLPPEGQEQLLLLLLLPLAFLSFRLCLPQFRSTRKFVGTFGHFWEFSRSCIMWKNSQTFWSCFVKNSKTQKIDNRIQIIKNFKVRKNHAKNQDFKIN